MLVACPRCKAPFRMVEFGPAEHVVSYLCPGCETIVRVDLEIDEVATSSSSGHYRGIERRKTVLIADDSREVLKEASDLLTEAGLRVVVASDGDEATRLIHEARPDVVVMDLLMPGKTGFEVLRELRGDERLKATPVLAMSRVYKENIIDFLHGVNAQGFIDKQHMRNSLVFRVLRLLTRPPASVA